eukprot:CAMPEP_0198230146 /NCGR_PEP_ID=MMETSP1445-20131203/114505_1 /TAXON_ID=36898 /ORGANISM="Pyramimonas sp., Strain CCMP2087" /LENGTH=126 /DNA_ID=CAMNT_0043910661 /DNA_START=1251 /DNA_END=1631 /DNA_ORIENTATION=+
MMDRQNSMWSMASIAGTYAESDETSQLPFATLGSIKPEALEKMFPKDHKNRVDQWLEGVQEHPPDPRARRSEEKQPFHKRALAQLGRRHTILIHSPYSAANPALQASRPNSFMRRDSARDIAKESA